MYPEIYRVVPSGHFNLIVAGWLVLTLSRTKKDTQ